MSVLAGSLIKAAELLPAALTEDRGTPQLTLTNAYQDIGGMTRTFTTLNNNAKALVIGVVDFSVTTAIGATGLCLAQLLVDGVADPSLVVLDANQVIRATVLNSWVVDLATAGSHTIKMQAEKSINAGVAVVPATHPGLLILLFDHDFS